MDQRKLAAITFTDMVGYSGLSQRDDKLALELLEEHRHRRSGREHRWASEKEDKNNSQPREPEHQRSFI
jgi:hypothetical protein